MSVLKARAQALYHNPDITIEAESDWLALALYAEDIPWLAEVCADAQETGRTRFTSAPASGLHPSSRNG